MMRRIAWGFFLYSVGYLIGRSVGRDECAKVVAKYLPPDASAAALFHPASRRSSAWN